jgi:hypothetical protein
LKDWPPQPFQSCKCASLYADDGVVFWRPSRKKFEWWHTFRRCLGLLTNRSKCVVHPIYCNNINLRVIWICTITIFQSWKYTTTIRLFRTIPLQFQFCPKYTTTYPFDMFLKGEQADGAPVVRVAPPSAGRP